MNHPDPPASCAATAREQRFGAIARLYGVEGARRIAALDLCVVGIGGVGSWAAEALARSGVGRLTLIDGDRIEIGNVNRQLHALDSSIDQPKVAAMAERIAGINPDCHCHPVADFLTERNLETLLNQGFDGLIDAIDSIRFKTELIAWCRRSNTPIVTTGGAGGRRDPSRILVDDLSRTEGDALAAKVRRRLRKEHAFPAAGGKRFGIDCVYSKEPPVYPRPDGAVGTEKPGISGVSLDCRFGYGSATFVTGAFGFAAAARLIEKLLSSTAAP